MPESKNSAETIEAVLGAGGIKLFCHIGFLRALEKRRVNVNMFTGASAGALAVAFYTNGYSPGEMLDIFLREDFRKAAVQNPLTYLNPLNYLSGGIIDIEQFAANLVKEYKLVPTANARYLGFNLLRMEAVPFEGLDFDMTKALGCSCAVPVLMKPVFYAGGPGDGPMSKMGVLMDGGLKDINPHQYSKGRAIIANLGFAEKAMPKEWLSPVDWYFHMLEVTWSRVLNWYFKLPENDHVVIDIAPKNVAGLTFGLSERACRDMADYAYHVALRALDDGIGKGLIPVKQCSPAREA